MVTTQIKNKALALFNAIVVAKKKESITEDVNSLMFVVMSGKTIEESINVKNLFDAVFERELNKRLEEVNNELVSINKFLNK
jgi:hypothetical protein